MLHKEAVRAITLCEVNLPLFFLQFTLHELLHIFSARGTGSIVWTLYVGRRKMEPLSEGSYTRVSEECLFESC